MPEPISRPRFGRLLLVWWLWHLIARLGPLFALVLVIGLFAVADHWKNGDDSQFFTAGNARTVSAPVATVFVAALGMTVVIIAGGIDLSAGTAQSLAATMLAWGLMHPGFASWNPWAAIALALGTGAACGLLNGTLIGWLRVVPFIVTLGSYKVYRGLAKWLASSTTVYIPADAKAWWFARILATEPEPRWLLVAPGVWVLLVLSVLLAMTLRYSLLGRYVYAVGSNEATARLCGINVPLIKVVVYAMGGLAMGLAGVLQFVYLGATGDPTTADGLELQVIAAVVIGGGSLSGGEGTVLGTLIGCLIISVLNNGCVHAGIPNPIQDIIIGTIIVAAVTLDRLRHLY